MHFKALQVSPPFYKDAPGSGEHSGAWYQPLLDTRRSSGSGPGPDTFKQLAA